MRLPNRHWQITPVPTTRQERMTITIICCKTTQSTKHSLVTLYYDKTRVRIVEPRGSLL